MVQTHGVINDLTVVTWLDRISGLVAGLCNLIIFTTYCKRLHEYQQNHRIDNSQKYLHTITTLTVVCYILHPFSVAVGTYLEIPQFTIRILYILGAWVPQSESTCVAIVFPQFFTFLFAKIFLYLALIYRCQMTFTNSAFELSKRLLWILFGSVFFATVWGFYAQIVYIAPGIYYDADENNCQATPITWLSVISILYDFGISFACLTLFIYKLWQLNQHNSVDNNSMFYLNSNNDNKKEKKKKNMSQNLSSKFYIYIYIYICFKFLITYTRTETNVLELIRKLTFLSCLAIISSFASFLIWALIGFAGLSVVIDDVINALCVVLMFKFNNDVYDNFWAIFCQCYCCCFLCIRQNDTVHNLSITLHRKVTQSTEVPPTSPSSIRESPQSPESPNTSRVFVL